MKNASRVFCLVFSYWARQQHKKAKSERARERERATFKVNLFESNEFLSWFVYYISLPVYIRFLPFIFNNGTTTIQSNLPKLCFHSHFSIILFISSFNSIVYFSSSSSLFIRRVLLLTTVEIPANLSELLRIIQREKSLNVAKRWQQLWRRARESEKVKKKNEVDSWMNARWNCWREKLRFDSETCSNMHILSLVWHSHWYVP